MAIGLKYQHSCVNCGGENTDIRNVRGLPCEICLPREDVDPRDFLPKFGTLKNLRFLWDFQKDYHEFESLFRDRFGVSPMGLQRLWMRRLILGKSFSVIAPTGVGKTTFGIASALWMEEKGKRSALVLPTVVLVDEVVEKLMKHGGKGVLGYHSRMKQSQKREALEKMEKGDFSILVVSSQFLSRNFDRLRGLRFDFVFVDDVDSVLKSSKNIDRLLMMIGFPEDAIEKALKNLKGKSFEIPEIDHGVLVVSSATAKPRGIRYLLFKELLNFSLGRLMALSRNVVNVRIEKRDLKTLVDLVELIKDGFLIFARNSEEAQKITGFLREKGYKVNLASDTRNLEDFKEGKLSGLVGIASYYGKIVRGIDLPFRVRFALFYGTPRFTYPIDEERAPSFVWKRVLKELAKHDRRYKKYLRRFESGSRRDFEIPEDVWRETVQRIFKDYITDEMLVIPDVLTYIQASGRTSRFTRWGLTKGVSILLEDDEKLFQNLRSRLEWLTGEEWLNFDEVDWDSLLEEVKRSRTDSGSRCDFETVLFIVESPTKAGTLSGFFGRSSTRYYEGLAVYEAMTENRFAMFAATRGHVYDLVTNRGIHGVEVVNGGFTPVYGVVKKCRRCGYQFSDDLNRCPKCGSEDLDDKNAVLKSLRELAMEVDRVIVATDPDTEGEKISHDVSQHLIPVNPNVDRVELHEITRREFRKGVENPRKVNSNSVKAQIVRRIQDRWIGFELSQRVQERFKRSTLSAGRVQSTVLGWVIEKEKEHEESLKTFTYLKFDGRRLEIEGEEKVSVIEVESIDRFEDELNPLPPHTTDTILAEASKALKISVSDVMEVLQDLFERGLITYHRTDSTRISPTGQDLARRIFEKLGVDIFQPRGWESGGAHEAIRPTKAFTPDDLIEMMEEGLVSGLEWKHVEVYRMVFRRFLVSQARSVLVAKQRVLLKIGGRKVEDEVVCEILRDGWNILNPVDTFCYEKKPYDVKEVKIYQKHTVPLFTQSSLIEEMKRKGIGRPSTYAKMVNVLFQRRYVFEDRYGRIRATKLGKMVYEFLEENFSRFVTEETTRRLEEMMDEVETGEEDYVEVLKRLYEDLKNMRSGFDEHLRGYDE